MADNESMLFDAIPQAPNLRTGLVNTLIAQIESGDLAPGQQLPTEQEIVAATGVSRTVVREALAALRARGLITTRQGLGAFVAKDPPPRTFSILPDDLESIDEVLRVLELRMGIEVEATGLAAKRRSDSALEQMSSGLDALEVAVRAGGSGSEEDFAFHRAILAATQNANFTRLFDAFGSAMIPRQWTRLDQMTISERETYLARMQHEHRAILAAIEAKDVNAARRAMRSHLTKSYARFEKLRDGASHD
ncbi:FadR family transcriptional regulator [Mesorhizobium sp. B292B1B]|uniref:FadR/GntR family transcriptional regulator n=1 Tax=unclassified Mesorhizobium TaxID=325217 RepID=UPI00112A1F09|nr:MULTISPECIES: FadR/GntR family transcriptional regulator [unclassified Mesorhizobium]MBZ9966640.1 FadR family transcriptional regulator [Mesorhizobium sp. BR1-1-2]MCA0014801.1 FadR family transcriptional regulator [Mesorhizobium sp. B294B1A1]MCA0041078.1 FadR family transcriptional regulator [Mesorhizobium sp. B292B1B]TPM42657.1 FadR family transcriptional regulator [Mesorhizobium sp. B2-3-2]